LNTKHVIVTNNLFLEFRLLQQHTHTHTHTRTHIHTHTHTHAALENPVNGSPDVNAMGPRPELGGFSMIHVVRLPHQTFINKAGGSCDVVCVLRESWIVSADGDTFALKGSEQMDLNVDVKHFMGSCLKNTTVSQ